MKKINYDVISPREAYAAYILGSVLVDVRTSMETQNKSVDLKRLKQIPFEELEARIGELPANKPVVFFSRVGVKGQQAAKLLSKNGFSQVAIVDGGVTAWEEEGLPVKTLN